MQWNPKNLQEFQSAIAEIFDVVIKQKNNDVATILCLHGELGVGKTTATQVIGKFLGISETINSPTFVIKKNYQTNALVFKNLVHIDAYRLENENTKPLRLEENFKDPDTLIVIEWPERISGILPSESLHVYIEHAGEGRKIIFK